MKKAFSSDSSFYGITLFFFIAIIVGVVMRVCGAGGDLWLDEIWALERARELVTLNRSPWSVFTSTELDGHASLATVLMYYSAYFGSEKSSAFFYRLPALVASLGSLALLFQWMRKDGRLHAQLGVALVSLSYLFILYGTEARGYSLMIFFALAAALATRSLLEQHSNRICIINNVALTAAFLSHYSAIAWCVALGSWFFFQEHKHSSLRAAVSATLKSFLMPLLTIVAVYFFQLRGLGPGSGPIQSYLDVVVDTLSLALGGPQVSSLSASATLHAMMIALVVLAVVLVELKHEFKEGRPEALLYLLAGILIPIVLIGVTQPRVLMPRYFLLSLLIALILIANFAARTLRSSDSIQQRAVPLSIVLLFILGTARYDIEFLRFGRGSYSATIAYIAQQSPSPEVLVRGDHDFRNAKVFRFFAGVYADKRLQYLEGGLEADPPAQWYLLHSQDKNFAAPLKLQEQYQLIKSFRSAALSGWDWHVYRRVDQNSVPPS